MGPSAHRSHSISDVSSFSTVSVLSFDPIRVRALCVEEPQLGCISSDHSELSHLLTNMSALPFKPSNCNTVKGILKNTNLVTVVVCMRKRGVQCPVHCMRLRDTLGCGSAPGDTCIRSSLSRRSSQPLHTRKHSGWSN